MCKYIYIYNYIYQSSRQVGKLPRPPLGPPSSPPLFHAPGDPVRPGLVLIGGHGHQRFRRVPGMPGHRPLAMTDLPGSPIEKQKNTKNQPYSTIEILHPLPVLDAT